VNAAIAARVQAASRYARVVRVGCFSGREEDRVLTITVRPCEPGGTAYATITWQPSAPGPDDVTAVRLLATQLKRLGAELRCKVLADSEAMAAKPAVAADLAWSTPSATAAAIEAPADSSAAGEASASQRLDSGGDRGRPMK
jgi:hypothetical protein